MMTACDLSAITKPWEVQSKVRVRPRACSLMVKHLQFLNMRRAPRLSGGSDGGRRVLGAGGP